MTTQLIPLDPADVNLTPDQAFAHPLPQIRQFHRQLTTTLDDKNARLRTLVGGSYRQLLGTAETILEMRKDIQAVEDRLGKVGEGCGRESIGRGVRGLGKLHVDPSPGEDLRRKDLEWMAKTKALSACALVVGRLLKRALNDDDEGRGAHLVLASKVLVLSRLLAKSVGDMLSGRAQDDKDVVDELKRKLATLRRRLLRIIERELRNIKKEENRTGLLQALAAYSLATSSGAKDVLRHFLHIRGEAMALAFEEDDDDKIIILGSLRAMELYTATLLDVQALVPRRLSEVLAGLKTKALLKDSSIRELEGLRLDIYEKWFGDEISYFTPYLRHDDLDVLQASDTLKGWSKRASEVLLQGVTQDLQRSLDIKNVVDLRTQILELWIKEGGKAKGFDPSILLNALRQVINGRLLALIDSRVSKLHLVGTEIEATLGSWQHGFTDKHESLWAQDILTMDVSNGAGLFKDAVISRSYGRNDPVHRVFSSYQTWRHLIHEIDAIVEQLKKQKWDDDLEDIEDDLVLESRNIAMSQEDPELLQKRLSTSLEDNYRELHERIEKLLQKYRDHESFGQISIYVLRIIRDIRTHLSQDSPERFFGLSVVPILHQRLAHLVSTTPLDIFAKTSARKRVPGRGLWEGDPELPVQPSPRIFKFLRMLSGAMSEAGSDLWSPNAIKVLKQHIGTVLSEHWAARMEITNGTAVSVKSINGSEETEGQDEKAEVGAAVLGNDDSNLQKELLIQSLFDLLILQVVFASGQDNWGSTAKDIESRIDLDMGSRKRLQHAAGEYWKRTSLLFGLLA